MKTLSFEEKTRLDSIIRQFIADECDMPVSLVTDEVRIIEDLRADSLMFLELIQEIGTEFKIPLLKKIGEYIVENPVRTVGDAIATAIFLIENNPDAALPVEFVY